MTALRHDHAPRSLAWWGHRPMYVVLQRCSIHGPWYTWQHGVSFGTIVAIIWYTCMQQGWLCACLQANETGNQLKATISSACYGVWKPDHVLFKVGGDITPVYTCSELYATRQTRQSNSCITACLPIHAWGACALGMKNPVNCNARCRHDKTMIG